jgi:hypothetical protein
MSAPKDRSQDPNQLSFYAPKGDRSVRLGRVSDAAAALMTASGPEDTGEERMYLRSPSIEPFEDPAIQRLRARQSLNPELVPQPLSGSYERSRLARVGRLGAVLFVAAVIALIATGGPYPTISFQAAKERVAEFFKPFTHRAGPSSTSIATEIPRLLVRQWRGTSGGPAPLGVTMQGRVSGAVVVVTGLIPGMTLTMGSPMGANAWQVPAKPEVLDNTWITPPNDFIGAVDLGAELHLADTTIAHRRLVHLEWVATPPAIAAVPSTPQTRSAVAPALQDPPVQRQLNRDELTMLIQHGKDFIANGDVVAARVLLQRAAESNDAEAALALAATYDPLVLRELKVYGIAADVAMARTWYEKAEQLGSAEAPRRLEALVAAIR